MRSDKYKGKKIFNAEKEKKAALRPKEKERQNSRETVVMSFEDLETMEEEYRENKKHAKTSGAGRRKAATDREKEMYYQERQRYDEKTEKQLRKENKQIAKMNKKRKKKGKKRGCFVFFLIILILLTILLGVAFIYLHGKLSKMQKVETNPKQFEITETGEKLNARYRNIAVLGIDARKGGSFKGSRSDAIVIISMDKSNGNVNLISIMRDSYLQMRGLNTSKMMLDKITHAHAFGGPINTCSAINRAMDLNIKEFVVMNWKAVVDAVDSLGGINLDIKPNEIRDLNRWGPETARNTGSKWKPVNSPGKQVLTGAQAATYCRIRKTSGGDPARNNRYKNTIKALLSKAKSNPLAVDKMLDKVLPQVQSNMKTLQILDMVPKITTFDVKKSVKWPYDYWGGKIRGKWLAVPKTLKSNNEKLYNEAFPEIKYVISNTANQINNLIINNTGIQ